MGKTPVVVSTNEILYRIQKALKLSTEEMLKTYKLEDYKMDATHLDALLKRRLDKGWTELTKGCREKHILFRTSSPWQTLDFSRP